MVGGAPQWGAARSRKGGACAGPTGSGGDSHFHSTEVGHSPGACGSGQGGVIPNWGSVDTESSVHSLKLYAKWHVL